MLAAFGEMPQDRRQRAVAESVRRLRGAGAPRRTRPGLRRHQSCAGLSPELPGEDGDPGTEKLLRDGFAGPEEAELAPVVGELRRAMESGRSTDGVGTAMKSGMRAFTLVELLVVPRHPPASSRPLSRSWVPGRGGPVPTLLQPPADRARAPDVTSTNHRGVFPRCQDRSANTNRRSPATETCWRRLGGAAGCSVSSDQQQVHGDGQQLFLELPPQRPSPPTGCGSWAFHFRTRRSGVQRQGGVPRPAGVRSRSGPPLCRWRRETVLRARTGPMIQPSAHQAVRRPRSP